MCARGAGERRIRSKIAREALHLPVAVTHRVASSAAVEFARAVRLMPRPPRLGLRQRALRRGKGALVAHFWRVAAAGPRRILASCAHRRLRLLSRTPNILHPSTLI